ncbi:helix-turn-helix domain-containing protein [Robertkochia marina]|uniref:Helix-turn-helix domain-containing protein n=1 Tax=Robertkochia marina TaxID=1227945 RepID=A0A4S3M2Z7_9FLAO|nr:helix-turn-helix transcriptional regulator [Robertkochia marina]THD67865.1 helix-turn-helix domain-containing protein [Robertkochia marina]TRZ42096.1 helix-turn-helix domain-containing protein [Robertkochia marina]
MINSTEFAQRLQKIMELYQLTASAFAESVGVQRSAISHILSGRNKPSLDFVLKILEAYPDVELYWLLNGKGPGPVKESNEETADLFNSSTTPQPPVNKESYDSEDKITHSTPNGNSRKILKVVVFYDDHTFEEISK